MNLNDKVSRSRAFFEQFLTIQIIKTKYSDACIKNYKDSVSCSVSFPLQRLMGNVVTYVDADNASGQRFF